MNDYSRKQLEIVEDIEKKFQSGQSPSTVVEPVSDYVNDNRICLTSLVFLPDDLENEINEKLIYPLKAADPEQYFFVPSSLHITIQNVRTIDNPPLFDDRDIEKAKVVFEKVVPTHHSIEFELKRLFELPTSLSICAFTDEKFGNLVRELRYELNKNGVPDNKKYASSDVVLGNSTFCRYTKFRNDKFQEKIKELKNIEVGKFRATTVNLLTTNCVCHPRKTKILGNYQLNTTSQ